MLVFECSICCEPSTEICTYCAKDACRNHLCKRCIRCSDCCECEVPLNAEPAEELVIETPAVEAQAGETKPEPDLAVDSPEPSAQSGAFESCG